MTDYATYYSSIIKPFFAPEPWVFGLAWGIIYPLIAITFILVVRGVYKKTLSKKVLWLFIINMIANFAFTPAQLGSESNLPGTVVILIVLVSLVLLLKQLCKEKGFVPLALLVPYLAWGAFATVLQISITVLNW